MIFVLWQDNECGLWVDFHVETCLRQHVREDSTNQFARYSKDLFDRFVSDISTEYFKVECT
jgi:hypothetical protein